MLPANFKVIAEYREKESSLFRFSPLPSATADRDIGRIDSNQPIVNH